MHIEVNYKYLCQAFSKCLLSQACQNVYGHTILMVNYTKIILSNYSIHTSIAIDNVQASKV